MRSFIRHPASVPIDFQLEDLVARNTDYLKNVSQGGLAFHSTVALTPGTTIRIKIPLVSPVFQAIGKVSWCHPTPPGFEIGVQFLDEDDRFRARMVEQICHIEQYRQEALNKEGRTLTGEQAAAEWIQKFATEFPDADTSDTNE
ncbi:MAG TPA: PilZ domain-containing protein [Gammaproteobacteria bacterium]|nr:PilZ domain-containing protein [Gammaproteobacteria bacterium]